MPGIGARVTKVKSFHIVGTSILVGEGGREG